MSTNPKWPEILESLGPNELPENRPDIVARVFRQKSKELVEDIKSGQVLGQTIAHTYTIEFQKRGEFHTDIFSCSILITGDVVDKHK
jgi:hypothetical protein